MAAASEGVAGSTGRTDLRSPNSFFCYNVLQHNPGVHVHMSLPSLRRKNPTSWGS